FGPLGAVILVLCRCRPKAVLIPPIPNRPPIDAPRIVLRAWRREVEVARALVNSSKFDGCISLRSFYAKQVQKLSQQKVPPNVKHKMSGPRLVGRETRGNTQ